MDTPAVSWLLCTHVADEQLQLALQSCLNQTFADFELLVVTNGLFAHEVAQFVQAWIGNDPRVRIFSTEVRHLSFSLSLGLHHARAPLIARMDSDDVSTSQRLAQQISYMQAHPGVVVLGTAYEIIDVDGRAQRAVRPPKDNTEIRRALLRGNPICHPSVMFRRKAVLKVGGYCGGLHAEDYDLWVRLSNDAANQFANLSEICLGYRRVGVGTARRSRSAYASMASAQFGNFIRGKGASWALAALLSTLKALIRSSPDR